jgi:DNA-binding transcriptional LysR family regulator
MFVAVVTHGSTLAASRRLGVSQPAVSAAITELEKHLRTSLFDRWKKRMVLNERGRTLLPMARLMLINARDLGQMFGADGKPFGGTLRLGASLTLANYVMPDTLSEFVAAYPHVKVAVACRNKAGIIAQIEDFAIDIGVIAGECPNPDVASKPWLTDELCVFAAASHPLARRARVTMADLTAAPWVIREEGSGTREVFLKALPNGSGPLRTVMEFDNIESIKRAVEYGQALSCLSRMAVKREVAAGFLRILPTPYLDLRREYFFLVHRQRHQSALLNAFLSHCALADKAIAAGGRVDG